MKMKIITLPFLKSRAGIAGVAAAMFLAGCQTTSQPAPRSALVQTPNGLLKCRDCKVANVQEPVLDPKGRIVGYRPRKVMECPDCKDVEVSMGEGDLTQHTCITCGESIIICSMHKTAEAPASGK